MTYTVTIDNLMTGQPHSPPVVATHPSGVVTCCSGEMASPGIAGISDIDPEVNS